LGAHQGPVPSGIGQGTVGPEEITGPDIGNPRKTGESECDSLNNRDHHKYPCNTITKGILAR